MCGTPHGTLPVVTVADGLTLEELLLPEQRVLCAGLGAPWLLGKGEIS